MTAQRSTSQVRVVIADDHDLFREAIAVLVDGEDDLLVVGTAVDGGDAVRTAMTERADVVLMDLHMPGVSGIDAIRTLADSAPHAAVVVLSMHEDDSSVVEAVRAGARGYVVKGAARDELLHAVRTAAAGGAVFGAGLARRLTRWFVSPQPEPFPQLTARERETLDLVARGLANDAIAKQLHLSPKTVRNMVSGLIRKLGVATRSEAIVRARTAGYGQPPPGP